jgi:hypothetical protein
MAADRDGWVTSETLRLRFRRAPDLEALAVVDLDDPESQAEI